MPSALLHVWPTHTGLPIIMIQSKYSSRSDQLRLFGVTASFNTKVFFEDFVVTNSASFRRVPGKRRKYRVPRELVIPHGIVIYRDHVIRPTR